MSYHILHLLSHSLKVRIKLDQLHITDSESGTEKTVPLADVAVIVCATRDTEFSASSLRRMAELNVLLLVCNEKFEPCAITLPYFRPTNTELLRRQIEWQPEWKSAMWRQIITAKVRNQAANVAHLKRAHTVLTSIAERCANPKVVGDDISAPPEDQSLVTSSPTVRKPSLATLTASKRAAFLLDSPNACESRAARHYWKHLLPRLSDWQETDEKRRVPGTREGVNGMLDYGYAILRTAVLRSLAAHGFIAAIGIAHAPKAGSFALADDVMEPLRPWIDRELRQFVQGGKRPMQEWMRQAVSVLQLEVTINRSKLRLLNAIDVYVQSFADAALSRAPLLLKIPMLP
ncbi:MAG: CRISPR-associated endonuclease Cas1 [Verrucomicrobiota bacterium]